MKFYTPVRLRNRQTEWMGSAACKGCDPNIFFSGAPTWTGDRTAPERREAKSVCSDCEVRVDCLEYAISNNIYDGTWGGMNESERAALKRQRSRKGHR